MLSRSFLCAIPGLLLLPACIGVALAHPNHPASPGKPAAPAKPDLRLDELKPLTVLKPRDAATPSAKSGEFSLHGASNAYTVAAQSKRAKDERELSYDMKIAYAEGKIYNPATGKLDKVYLRAYNGQFIAPLVIMKPGQTVRFNLFNQLPVQPETDCAQTGGINTPAPNGCFNTTNLHSHGLWISPAGNSDNVLIAIQPTVNFEYEYNVPADHPAGTFWYHPHKHGTTAMQVASGMAGALVIKGDRLPTQNTNGDVDTLLKSFEPKDGTAGEVKLLQQIPYGCFSDPGKPGKNWGSQYWTKLNTVLPADAGPWKCDDTQTGYVENFGKQVGNPTAWATSQRYTLINGQARPTITMKAGQVVRWRLIDAGFNETVNLKIRKVVDPLRIVRVLADAKAQEDEVKGACLGAEVTQFEVASDGLTHEKIIAKTTNVLQPGYRSDVLFAIPEKGYYCVYDAASKALTNAGEESAKVLAIISADGTAKVSDQAKYIQQHLKSAAQRMPVSAPVRDAVLADLSDANNMKLSKFVPHPTITDEEIKRSGQPVAESIFYLGPDLKTNSGPVLFQVNEKSYDEHRIDHTLILGKAQTWNLGVHPKSLAPTHPFHIHVNPFQVHKITKINKLTGKPDPNLEIDDQYKGLVGTWRDTLLASNDHAIEVRTRYERYIGEYVLHCHILEHEDQGMMQNVKVVLPDGKGGAAKGAHSH